MTKANAIHELRLHRFSMQLVRILLSNRKATCEHCETLLKDIYKCMHEEVQDKKNRSNDE
jgi:hypothetical protein